MGLPPIVTGVSPKEGPPGTRVTIRGENLGYGPDDIIGLSICGSDCLLSAEWKSSNKVIARSGPGKGRGDIIVTTKSGGSGTCTVQFRGFHETIGPLKESAVWVDESHLLGLGRHRPLLPASFQQEDPLGLSVENTEKKFPEEELHDLFPEGSGDLGLENFTPAWFLLENHHATSFDDLRAGMSFLKRKVDSQKEGQISFLKAHVGSIIEQMDTLANLKEKIKETEDILGPNLTASLENSIYLAKIEADRLFEDVLERKDRADATRNALSTMQRFRFLFHLPASLDNNIQKGDYDLVINDYARAKALFGNTDVKIFKKVLQEADLRIAKLRQLLSEKLVKYPASLEEQKKIIRNLVNLEAPDNPAWNCISGQYKYTSRLLFDCKDTYLAKEEETGKGSNYKQGTPKTANADLQNNTTPGRITFLEEVTDLFYASFPELWRLGQAYFSGELHARVEPSKQPEFKRMSIDTVTIYSQLVRAAFIPQTLDRHSPHRAQFGLWQPFNSAYTFNEGVGSWLVTCLRSVRTCYTSLLDLNLPPEPLSIVKDLLHDLRVHCMRSILLQATENIQALVGKENLNIEYVERHGSVTQLPHLFETQVLECLQLVKETVFQAEKSEPNLLENASVLSDLNILVQKLLVAFSKTLDRVASLDTDDESIGRETRVLLQLSNCQYTITHVIPRFEGHWRKLGYPDLSAAVGVALQQLRLTDEKLLEAYLEEKVEPLIGIVEPSMYSHRFDWNTKVEPHDVRPYCKEIILNMIAVHAEVGQICPSLVNQILGRVVKEIGAELGRLFSCVQKFSRQGILQARADVAALSRAAITFAVDEPFAEAQAIIPTLQTQEDQMAMERILENFERRMRFQLCCLDPTVQQS